MSSLKLHSLEKTTGPRTVGFLLTRFFCKCPRRKVAKANKITPLPDSGGGLENRRSATLNKTEVCRYNGLATVALRSPTVFETVLLTPIRTYTHMLKTEESVSLYPEFSFACLVPPFGA